MPAYFVNTAAFDPVSYEQFVDAADRATTAHKELEEQYGTYKAGMKQLETMLDRNNKSDKGVIGSVDKYNEELKRVTQDLQNRGLTRGNQAALQNLMADYTGISTGITNAYNARQAAIDNINELRLSNPDMEFTIDPSSLGLSSYWGSRRPTVQTVKGNDMYAQAAALAQNISNNQELKTEIQNMLGGAFLKSSTGIPLSDVYSFMNNNYAGNDQLKKIFDVLTSQGAYSQLDDAAKGRINKRIMEGILAGIQNNTTLEAIGGGSGSGSTKPTGVENFSPFGSGLEDTQSFTYTEKNPFRNIEWDKQLGISPTLGGFFKADVKPEEITEEWISKHFTGENRPTVTQLKRYLDDREYSSASFNLSKLGLDAKDYMSANGNEVYKVDKDGVLKKPTKETKFEPEGAIPHYDTRTNQLYFKDKNGLFMKVNSDQLNQINTTMSDLEDWLYGLSASNGDATKSFNQNGLSITADTNNNLKWDGYDGNITPDQYNTLRYSILAQLFKGG